MLAQNSQCVIPVKKFVENILQTGPFNEPNFSQRALENAPFGATINE